MKYIGLFVLIMSQASWGKTCNKRVEFNSGSRIKPVVYKCLDGTVSYKQIKSTFVPSRTGTVLRYLTGSSSIPTGRTESYCGATAAVNVHNAYCKKYFVSPSSVAKKYFDDINPGVRYDTMLRGLNRFFSNQGNDCVNGHWSMSHPRTNAYFIKAIYNHLNSGKGYWKNPKTKKRISPVIVLINRTPKTTSLHWVTVVGIEGFNPNRPSFANCVVKINEWGRQTRESCLTFAKHASQVNSPTLLKWMHDYYLLRYN